MTRWKSNYIPNAAVTVRQRPRWTAQNATKGKDRSSVGCASAARGTWGHAANATRAPSAPAPARARQSRAPAVGEATATAGSAFATHPCTERCMGHAVNAMTSRVWDTEGSSVEVRSLDAIFSVCSLELYCLTLSYELVNLYFHHIFSCNQFCIKCN